MNKYLVNILKKTHDRIQTLDPLEMYLDKLDSKSSPPSFTQALKSSGLSCIAEIKAASPSKGILRKDFQPLLIAKEFESIGASAISVLTEESYFKGHLKYLEDVSKLVNLPTLRKDFILDERQIVEAKLAGASAILLIVAILDPARLNVLHAFAKSLDLAVLVEIHQEQELHTALNIQELEIIGINNRNLETFETSLDTVLTLAPICKAHNESLLIVAESAYQTTSDLAPLPNCGVDAVLIGEGLIKSPELIASFNA